MSIKYDFSGWATKNDLKCSDGRTIRKGAFSSDNGRKVPLVWNHQHNNPENVLGHAVLEERPEGMYAYCTFNDSEMGENCRQLVKHGDVDSLSIWANQLKQSGGDVLHGVIREVSLVLAGANPGAMIDMVLEHGDDGEAAAMIITGEQFNSESGEVELEHSDSKEQAKEEKKEESKEESKEDDKTVGDVLSTLNDDQKKAVAILLDEITKGDDEEDTKDSDEGDGESMKHNVFDNETTKNRAVLSHSDMQQIFADAKRCGSLRDAIEHNLENGVLAHAVYNHDEDGNPTTEQTYGIADINYLFPDARSLNNPPEFIKRDMDWVRVVMNGTHHTPFSRVKSKFANITMDEARARGYIKGKMKKEEVFSLLKRSTDPQTVYKKQKLDRDDIIDITDFDVVAWIKAEMRMMLEEEIARAILIGDGRLPSDDDHISEDHIRPIWTDADLYTIKIDVEDDADPEVLSKNFIKSAIRARKQYKGSGNPIMFTTEDMLTEMLLIEDGIGHHLYKSEADLATTLRVRSIVTVPVMENQVKEGKELMAIIVNLNDYNIGADKGGQTAMFDDFDIDYNQYKYLIETRCSGALIKPYSAMVLQKEATTTGG